MIRTAPTTRVKLALAAAVAVLAAGPAGAHAQQLIKVTGSALSATEGAAFGGTVATVNASCQTFSGATVDWGDGSASPADGHAVSLKTDNGTCLVQATHAYAEEGKYTTMVAVAMGSGSTFTGAGAATVADAPLTLHVNALGAVAGTAFTGAVATFTDAAPLEADASYSATIDWGDGTSSAGSIAAGVVSGNHTYASAGSPTLTVTVHDEGGASATGTATATIAAPRACAPLSAAPGAPATPAGTTPNQRYVDGLYRDLLGRQPGPAELAAFAHALDLGATRATVALDVATSTEARSALVDSLYQSYLRRPADTAGRNALIGLLANARDEDARAQVLGSGEYLASLPDASNNGFVDAAYCDVLGRHADPAALDAFGHALGTGGSRAQVALAILTSAEARQNLIGGYYRRFLRRQPDAAGAAGLLAQLGAGASDEQLLAALLGSTEYFNLLNPAASGVGGVQLTAGVLHVALRRPGILDLTVLRLVARRAAATPGSAAPATKRVRVVHLGRHAAGELELKAPAKLPRGRYLLVVKLRSARTHKLVGVGDAVPYRVK
jgi:PKD repeat protein